MIHDWVGRPLHGRNKYMFLPLLNIEAEDEGWDPVKLAQDLPVIYYWLLQGVPSLW